jgi:hypothetical protein
MNPEIKRDKPVSCPICGMDLVPEKTPFSADFLRFSVINSNQPARYQKSCIAQLELTINFFRPGIEPALSETIY